MTRVCPHCFPSLDGTPLRDSRYTFKIRQTIHQVLSGILEKSQCPVAVMTEKPTDSSRAVVVIYNECTRMGFTHRKIFLMTNSAGEPLCLCHIQILLYCYVVISFQISLYKGVVLAVIRAIKFRRGFRMEHSSAELTILCMKKALRIFRGLCCLFGFWCIMFCNSLLKEKC